MAKKTAILIYCTHKERDCIKLAAKMEHRTITGFVMNAVSNRLEVRERLRDGFRQYSENSRDQLDGSMALKITRPDQAGGRRSNQTSAGAPDHH